MRLRKTNNSPGKWILTELFLSESCQCVNPLSSIDGFDGDQDAHMRGDLKSSLA
jgi:hypothetical protein